MNQRGGHIPEHELLEFIEGTLPADRGAVVAAALARDPHLARLVASLKADKRTLAALGDVRAPAELAERIEAILERQALLGLSDLGAAVEPASLPVSRLRPSRGSIVGRVRRSPAGRGLAVAAVLALVAGGGVWGYSLVRQGLTGLGAGGGAMIASGGGESTDPVVPVDPAPRELTDAAIAAATDEPGESDGSIEVAISPVEPVGAEALVAMGTAVDAAVSDAAAAVNASPAARGVATASGGREDAISPERAVELARAGRLAIIVESADAETTAARMDALVRGHGGSGGGVRAASWRRVDGGAAGGVMAPGFEMVAALWSPQFLPRQELPAISRPDGGTTVAGTTPGVPMVWPGGGGVRVPMDLPRWSGRARPPAAVYAVSVQDAEGAVGSLLASVKGAPGVRGARFVELPVAIDPAPASDADAVLWWMGGPASWSWRVSVPVVVEGVGR